MTRNGGGGLGGWPQQQQQQQQGPPMDPMVSFDSWPDIDKPPAIVPQWGQPPPLPPQQQQEMQWAKPKVIPLVGFELESNNNDC